MVYSFIILITTLVEVLNLPRKETINQLIGLCDDFIHEIMIDFYEEHYFTFIKDALVQKIIRDNSPITEDSIKEYIVSYNYIFFRFIVV